MNRGWPDRCPRSLAAPLALAIAVGSLLSAQAFQEKTGQETARTTPPAKSEAAPPTSPSEQSTGTTPSASEKSPVLNGLIGSKHDFSHGGALEQDLCTPCHTPHLVAPPRPELDRRASVGKPLRPYEGIDIDLTGWSLLCLGCHDGTIAPDVYTSVHAIEVSQQLGEWRFGGSGLRSHPVGVKYPSANNEYFNTRAAVEAAGLELSDGRIQCTTCHDPHNTERHEGMLRISNRRSRVCLTCHRR